MINKVDMILLAEMPGEEKKLYQIISGFILPMKYLVLFSQLYL
jgi:hypothetical protein